MKVIVLGTGFVGLTHAAVLAERGLNVVACDSDPRKLAAFSSGEAEQIEKYVNEPGLSGCVRQALSSGCLQFSTDATPHLKDAAAVFLCLPTPASQSGATNLTQYRASIRELIKALSKAPRVERLILINKSTVPIGTTRGLVRELEAAGIREVGVAANPEFLAQGEAVEASRRPSRVVVGAEHEADFAIMRRLYAPYVDHGRVGYLETTPETAEAVKYVSNALLFTYVSFWNGVAARLGETIESVRMSDLRLGVTSDTRISDWGSHVGNGAVGSCFGKDLRSLAFQMRALGLDTNLLSDVLAINEVQKTYLIERAEQELGVSFEDKTVAIAGLSFKKSSNDLDDSPAVTLIESLLARGVKSIRAYDPLVTEECARRHLDCGRNPAFERVEYFRAAQRAIEGSEALFISNDSDEFHGLASVIRQTVVPPYAVIDGRRMLADASVLIQAGYGYLCVGESARKTPVPMTAGEDVAA